MMTCAGYFISVVVGLILCITLEFPFTALLKEMFRKASNEEVEGSQMKPINFFKGINDEKKVCTCLSDSDKIVKGGSS